MPIEIINALFTAQTRYTVHSFGYHLNSTSMEIDIAFVLYRANFHSVYCFLKTFYIQFCFNDRIHSNTQMNMTARNRNVD